MNWLPVTTPPPIEEHEEFYFSRSKDVLGFDKYGNMMVVYYRIEDEENTNPAWITSDSEGWNVTDHITHWQPLPPKPSKEAK